MLFIPDTHVPFHDKKAWALLLEAAAGWCPETIVIQGDFADFYTVSSHSKDPRRERSLQKEVNAVKEALRELDALGAGEIIYVSGNHEDRLSRYLQEKAPELFETVDIPSVLGLDHLETRTTYVPYKEYYQLGPVYLTHDVGTAGANAHRDALNAFQDNAVIGHTHRMAYIVEGNAKGSPHVAAMFGWLGDFDKVDYMHRVKANRAWAHGFGIGHLDRKRNLIYLSPVPIVKGTCVVDGVRYGR